MTLDCTPEELKFLKGLHTAFQRAQREFTIAFTASMYARNVKVAHFVEFTPSGVVVDVPEQSP